MIDSETAANNIAIVIQKWNRLHGAEFEKMLAQREQARRDYLYSNLGRFLPCKLALFLASRWPGKYLPSWDKVFLQRLI